MGGTEVADKQTTWPELPANEKERAAFLANRDKVDAAINSIDFAKLAAAADKYRAGNSNSHRATYMSVYGFTSEAGKGDHQTWTNPLLTAYAKFHNMHIPQNMWNIRTSEQPIGYESVDMGGKSGLKGSWGGTVARNEWVTQAIERKAKTDLALKEIQQEARGLTEDRRQKTSLHRQLCQKFKAAGVAGAKTFLAEIKPELGEITDRIEYRQAAIQAAREVMKQRVGDIGMRKPR